MIPLPVKSSNNDNPFVILMLGPINPKNPLMVGVFCGVVREGDVFFRKKEGKKDCV
jgi:hypothetical protein